jgi:hypothetical protein
VPNNIPQRSTEAIQLTVQVSLTSTLDGVEQAALSSSLFISSKRIPGTHYLSGHGEEKCQYLARICALGIHLVARHFTDLNIITYYHNNKISQKWFIMC